VHAILVVLVVLVVYIDLLAIKNEEARGALGWVVDGVGLLVARVVGCVGDGQLVDPASDAIGVLAPA